MDQEAIAPRSVLVLYWTPTPPSQIRAAIRHHLEAIKFGPSRHRVTFWNAFDGTPAMLRKGTYDAVILHTTLLCLRWFDTFPKWRDTLRWLGELDALKIALPQDEYDHSEVLDEWLVDMGVDHLFSNFGADVRSLLYPSLAQKATFQHALTGYIDEKTAQGLEARLKQPARRPFDVVYRASRLPYWFGSLGQLKHRIGEQAQVAAAARSLKADISTRTDDAIMGDEWFDFLAAGRVVVGCESGSSVLDRRGDIQKAIRSFLASHPRATFEEVASNMPPGWDAYHFAAVSPRHLEAVITKTCQVLVTGRYDNIFQAGRHYIPVQSDLADLGEALQRASDPTVATEITERAYEEIYRSGRNTYRVLAEQIDLVLATRPPVHSNLQSGLSAVTARVGNWRLNRSPDHPSGWLEAGLGPTAAQTRRSLVTGALGGRIGRGLLSAYLWAGQSASSISTTRLLAECLLLNRVSEAQMAEPRTPAFRAVKAVTDASALELSVLRRAPDGRQEPVGQSVWPPQSIVVRAPSYRTEESLNEGVRLEAVTALAAIQPGRVRAALRPLLDETGGARARPGLGGPRARLKTLLATGRVLLEQPGNFSILARAIGRAPLWDAADDVVKLSLLSRLRARAHLATEVEAATGTLRVTTEASGANGGGYRISPGTEIKRIVWDNSAVADHVLLPIFGRHMTVFLGAGGVHEFTAIEALPRSARESALRRLES